MKAYACTYLPTHLRTYLKTFLLTKAFFLRLEGVTPSLETGEGGGEGEGEQEGEGGETASKLGFPRCLCTIVLGVGDGEGGRYCTLFSLLSGNVCKIS